MAKDKKTLSDLFTPPSGALQGIHAMLCAYSADEGFLRKALDKFTGIGPQSRLARGSVDATLVLDSEHQIFEAQDVSGLRHLYPKLPEARPWSFNKMHAKVALLAFGKCRVSEFRADEPIHYRIVVNTGNWTEASAKRLIEMAWHIDISADSKNAPDLRDLHACATFFSELLGCYHAEPPIADKALILLHRCLARGMAAGPRTSTRFSSNLPVQKSADPQSLLHRFRAAAQEDGTARNILVCGSGFYEQDIGTNAPPRVIKRLIGALREDKQLTANPEVAVVLNPEDGGQVARHCREANDRIATPYRPKDPMGGECGSRTQLHAKFCYIGNLREGGLSSGLLYLGSGNLTFPGFVSRPNRVDETAAEQANIEAGVFIRTNAEDETARIDTWLKLKRLLPIGDPLDREEIKVQSYADEDEKLLPANKPPPPVTAFSLRSENSLKVHWAGEKLTGELVEVDIPGQATIPIPAGVVQIPLERVTIAQWLTVRSSGIEWRVPCLDSNGEYPRSVAREVTFITWLDGLADFPGSWNDPAADDPDVDGDDAGNEVDCGSPGDCSRNAGPSIDRNFPAHAAALLVESIAHQNGAVTEDYMDDYLAHLRRALTDELPPGFLDEWRALRINFLTPLLVRKSFAPEWEDLEPYDQLVKDVMNEWGFNQFPRLEVLS